MIFSSALISSPKMVLLPNETFEAIVLGRIVRARDHNAAVNFF